VESFVKDELIFMTIAGSNMYGMATEESDIDKRGVCVPPKNVVMGFARVFNQQEFPNEDTTVFSLMKFMDLATACNPNIIELLFAPEDCIQTIHPTWERLLARRDEFLSAKSFYTFTGYAFSQLKRIKGHRSWLMDPPTHQPTRGEFGLWGAGLGARELVRGVDASKLSPEVTQVIEKEKKYKAALTRWSQYEEWKKRRNPKRAALEIKYGYDTKHASHLIRLLRMGEEILTKGTLHPRREDAADILSIRSGSRTYDQLIEEAEGLQAKLEKIYKEKTYVVPHHSDVTGLSDFAVELHDWHWTHYAKGSK
jgi:predicted nucleotidyltransferase